MGTTEYYYCVVTATRTDNSQTATATSSVATVSVGKATPTITTAPTASAVTYGQTLASSTLSDGAAKGVDGVALEGTWTWVDSTASVGNVGENTFKANFTPSDTANYNTISNVDVSVTVGKANGPAAPTGLSGVAPTAEGGNDGKITGVDTTMEYSANGTEYIDCPGTTIPNLTAGTYYVRVKETATHDADAAKTVEVPAYVALTAPVFGGHGMLLDSLIGVTFQVKVPADFDATGAYMAFSLSDGRRSTVPIDDSTHDVSGNTYTFTCYLNALELADEITATFHYGTSETITGTYAATTYLTEARQIYSGNEKMLVLLDALQNYGYYLQQSGWTDNRTHTGLSAASTLNTDSITAAQTALSSVAALTKSADFGTALNEGIKYSLTLNEDTKINLFAQPKDGTTLTGGRTETIDGGTWHRFSSEGIAIKNLDSATLISVSYNADGSTGSATVSVSALTYIKSALADGNMENNKKLALTALYRYYETMKAYAANQ